MSVLVSLALGAVLAAPPSVRPAAGGVHTAALSTPPRPRPPAWARPTVSLAPGLYRARLSRRAGASRVERGLASLGARAAGRPPAAWTGLARSVERPAGARRPAATFERGPPALS
ncbi:MAG TPA: hypothetical protein VFE68_15725 [Vicinamibacteria bacterium]|nr:hypothetical protein [Vicinamibacteria bacterium]